MPEPQSYTSQPDLRDLLWPVIEIVVNRTTQLTLAAECQRLGLPEPPDAGSKRERVNASYYDVPDESLPELAERILRSGLLSTDRRNAVQDCLWAAKPYPEITKRTRREIARTIDIGDLVHAPDSLMSALADLWDLDRPYNRTQLFGPTLRDRITKHVINNDDWTAEDLFDSVGAFEATHRRFALFIEALASADVLLDEPLQRNFVAAVNGPLKQCGLTLIQIGFTDGYPAFQLICTQAASTRRPKNVIFASPFKPVIRLRDAVNNDIEVDREDEVLIYDRPIGVDGLRHRDLQQWWKDTQEATTETSLYQRLLSCLPDTSPPQRALFVLYHRIYDQLQYPDLPALLPEVWLHWDPKSRWQRGTDALPRFRMDFLMLLPNGIRIVIEIDGRHHYSIGDKPSPEEYAKNMSADRELKLNGYEVFRFGAAELPSDTLEERLKSRGVVEEFFRAVFDHYRIDLQPRAAEA